MKKLLITAAMLATALPFTFDGVTPTVSKAQAVIGRPLTPLSVAGVHRRAVRRTYGVGGNLGYHPVARAALYGAAGYGAGYYGAGYGGWGGSYGYGSYGYPSYGYSSYGYPRYGYGFYGYPSYGYSSYAYPSYGYSSYGYPGYGYGGYYRPGYRVARRVAIHHARWH